MKYSHHNWHKKQGQTRHWTIFHLIGGAIFFIAFMQGIKAGVFGAVIGLAVGAGAAWAFPFGAYIFGIWLPKRLGIYDLIRYREETEEALNAKEKVLSTIYMIIIICLTLTWLILCSFCSHYLTKLQVKLLLG